MSKLPSAAEREAFIRQYAKSIGIDPDIAIRVAKSEGLGDGIWQGRSTMRYGRERSYGDFQLHDPPADSDYSPGVGSAFRAETGLDPSDPANWKEMNMFALNHAKKHGWGDWVGAGVKGISGFAGISSAPSAAPSYPPPPARSPQGAALGSFLNPADINARIAAENSANPSLDQTALSLDQTDPLLDALSQTPGSAQPPAPPYSAPSKSPQEIYAEYLQALSEVTTRREPYKLKLQLFDTVSYE